MKIRLSKKFLLITGSVLVLCAGSGAAAVFVGADKLLGPSYIETNGLACTTLQTDRIKRDHRSWIRKYVVSDKPGDGMARIQTALRVARAVQEKEKADLVQVAILDKAGPTERADMRGRVIGAQVVYIPDLSKAPDGAQAQTYSAYYVDGPPTAKGEYFGLRIDLPLEDVEALSAKLTDKADCVDPVVAVPEGEHGAPAAHGDKKKPKPKGGEHGASSEHGEAAGHGEPSAHGEAPVATDHDGTEQVASKESGGFMSSVTSMIFGSKEAAPAAVHGTESEAHPAEDEAKPADAHAVPVTEPVTRAEQHEATKPAAAEGDHQPAASAGPTGQPATKAEISASKGEATAVDAPKEEGGFLSSVTGMLFGSGGAEKPAEPQKEASVEVKPSDPVPVPRTSAEGGKRWSSQTQADAVHGSDAPQAPAEAAPKPTDGSTAADAAGAAWLAKFRQQQAGAAQPGH
ncbi:hypothetical protein EPK99_11530 [Neorhizobium lilium]|uniref:Uncharacterized protein n=1 Tax=Neorhizobium lilium TaxID=2503024 RepID=A0A3S3U0P2_9HYPH|nr:hypothetical protein [Neorhizobium lilium]RWX79187.1 hypothetical protein EPK99_11530 [Neorhizobium lilium]